MVYAPWTQEQVDAANAFQHAHLMHPFTCPYRPHYSLSDILPGAEEGLLYATEEGWVCNFCDYKQNWAYFYMLDPEFVTNLMKAISCE